MTFSVHANDTASLTAVYAEGVIRPGDARRLKRYLEQQPSKANRIIYFSSRGGSLYEGLLLGLMIYEARIKTGIENGETCASACAFAFMAGSDRQGKPWRAGSTGSRFGVHAFSSPRGIADEADTQAVVADILKFSQLVELPEDVLIAGFSTASDDMYWFTPDELCRMDIKVWNTWSDEWFCQ